MPGEFSVVPRHQVLPSAILAEIAGFIHVFDQVTTHEAWQAAARREAPAIAQLMRPEVCFFSAWDFHLPPEGGSQLIEFNDNGSGFLFAAIINTLYHEAAGLGQEKWMAAPAQFPAFNQHIGDLVEQEARAFFEERPVDLFLILDDAESLQHGKFRKELRLLCDLLRPHGCLPYRCLRKAPNTLFKGAYCRRHKISLLTGVPVGRRSAWQVIVSMSFESGIGLAISFLCRRKYQMTDTARRIALVTGATNGIGIWTALGLAKGTMFMVSPASLTVAIATGLHE